MRYCLPPPPFASGSVFWSVKGIQLCVRDCACAHLNPVRATFAKGRSAGGHLFLQASVNVFAEGPSPYYELRMV